MADLITLNEYKTLVGVDPTNTVDDARITALIPAASATVRKYTDRKFEVASGPPGTERFFQYDGSGFLDIDDCTNITQVATDVGVPGDSYALAVEQWTPQPADPSEPYYYILLHTGPFRSFSPEMGFERNLDKYEPGGRPVVIGVTAQWGWASIPKDVKLATAWMVQDTVDKPGGDNLSAEAIEGFSRAWAGSFQALALPNRARDLLANYQRAF